MKNLYYQFLFILSLLLSIYPYAVVLSYEYIPDENGIIIQTTTGEQITIPLGPDVIKPDNPFLFTEDGRLLMNYEGNTVSITNPDTYALEAVAGLIQGNTPCSINGDIFVTEEYGSGTGKINTSQEKCQQGQNIIVIIEPDLGSSLTDYFIDTQFGGSSWAQFDLIPEVTTSIIGIPPESTVSLAGGIFRDGIPPEKKVVLSSSTKVDVRGIMMPVDSSKQIDEVADILVAVSNTPPEHESNKIFYMLNSNGIEPWDTVIGSLLPFKEDIQLENIQPVGIYSGTIPKGLWEVYFGFRLQKTGTIIFNSEPFKIIVNK